MFRVNIRLFIIQGYHAKESGSICLEVSVIVGHFRLTLVFCMAQGD